MHPREKEIKIQIALGTLVVDRLCGSDFLAIEDINTMFAIKKEHEKRFGHTLNYQEYEDAWLSMITNPTMTKEFRYEAIKRQETK